ncbi:hypothetical protein ACFE04_029302 [Oxalis oulophora]
MAKIYHKSKDYYPQKAKGMSFYAFIVSVFIYISVFYIFNLSPSSTLLSNHKFWFFISNTLILIIAADYGAYTSCKGKSDVYDDYLINNRRARNNNNNNNQSSFVSTYEEIVDKTTTKEEATRVHNFTSIMYNNIGSDTNLHEKKQENDICYTKSGLENNMKIRENEIEPEEKRVILESNENLILVPYNTKKEEKKIYKRSKSDISERVLSNEKESKRNILHRAKSEKHELDLPKEEEDHEENIDNKDVDDEFTTMSNEELNRRVEEFIKKFNREIRLQNSTRRHQLQY